MQEWTQAATAYSRCYLRTSDADGGDTCHWNRNKPRLSDLAAWGVPASTGASGTLWWHRWTEMRQEKCLFQAVNDKQCLSEQKKIAKCQNEDPLLSGAHRTEQVNLQNCFFCQHGATNKPSQPLTFKSLWASWPNPILLTSDTTAPNCSCQLCSNT